MGLRIELTYLICHKQGPSLENMYKVKEYKQMRYILWEETVADGQRDKTNLGYCKGL